MRALVISEAGHAAVTEVPEPVAAPGEAVIEVARAGICGTDHEFFSGEMAYLRSGFASYPIRIGHEWTGTVLSVGAGVDPGWIGRRVIGDTMLGCGDCARCRRGRGHVCATRQEVGIRGGRRGALAERLAVPVRSLHALPDSVDDAMGAMVEPGGNAARAVAAAALKPGEHCLIVGAGTIGLLAALFAKAQGAVVHLADSSERARSFAASIGIGTVGSPDDLPDHAWGGVIDASTGARVPADAVARVEPGGRVVFIGLAGSPSLVDSRALVLGDITAVGVLSASPGLPQAIAAYASGAVDPRPLIAATLPLERMPDILAGRRPPGSGPGPKFHARP